MLYSKYLYRGGYVKPLPNFRHFFYVWFFLTDFPKTAPAGISSVIPLNLPKYLFFYYLVLIKDCGGEWDKA